VPSVVHATNVEGEAPGESAPARRRERHALPACVAGRYTLDASLGSGGMGEVFSARDELTGERVALKIVRRSDAAPRGVERLLREAVAASRATHPAVVKVFEASEDSPNDLAFIAQELLVGETLRARLLRRGRLSPAEAVAILAPVVDALAAAHEAGVVHRDLKPENIFLEGGDEAPRPRVIDFGIARLVADDDATRTQLTVTGSVLGTPAYMSPEQARGADDVDEQTDVWAVGVVLHELLTGATPFARATPHATLAAILLDVVPSARDLAPDVPEALAAVAGRALSRNRVERFGSMRELSDALREASHARALPPDPRHAAATPSARGRVLRVALGVLALALIAASSFALRPRTAMSPRPTDATAALAPRESLGEAPTIAPPPPVFAVAPPPSTATRAPHPRRASRPAAPPLPPVVAEPPARRTNGAPILGL
jgi:serine/threonine protein kinase